MPVSLGSGDDGTPNDFTAAIARRLGVNQPAGLQSGYQYSSASPAVQNSQPSLQDTRTALTPQPGMNQGYQYSSGSPSVQNAQPGYQATPSQGQSAPSLNQQNTWSPPPSPAKFGMNAADASSFLSSFNAGQQGGSAPSAPTRTGPLSGAFNQSEMGSPLSPGTQAATGAQNYGDLSPSQQQQMQQAGIWLQAPGLAADAAGAALNAPRGIAALGGGITDLASAIGRRFGMGAAGAADATRLNALRSAANVGQDAMRFGQPGNQGLNLADRLGTAPYSSADVGPIAQPLSDVAARNAALDATRTVFPSEIPIQDVAAQNLGGMGGAIQRLVTNPNVYAGAGIGGAVIGAGALAQQPGSGSASTTPTGSATPIIDANTAANNPNNIAAAAGRGGSLAGPAQGGGTVQQPTIQQPATPKPPGFSPPPAFLGPPAPLGGKPGSQGFLGPPAPLGGRPGDQGFLGPPSPLGGATGSVTPIISQGSQSAPTSGGTPSGGSTELNQVTQQAQNDLTGLQSMIQDSKSPDVLNVFLQQGQSIMDMLKQQEDTLRSDAQKNGTTIDPATQFTLDTMQKQLDTQLSGVRDNLNRRGLLQSGIELASENQVRSGNLSAEGQLLSTRLSNIQKNLEAGLQSVNTQRFTAMKDIGLAGAGAQATADNNALNQRDSLARQLVTSRLALRGQMNTANEGNLTRQNQSSIAAANRQSQQSIANANLQASGNRLNQTEQFSAQQSSLQQQASDARQAASLAAAAGNEAARQQYAAQAAELQRQFQAGQDALYRTPASATPSPTATGSKLATDNFIVQLEGAPDQQSAINAFNQAVQDGTFANAGADPVSVLNAINQKQWGGGGFHPFGIGQ